jgi:hypothetical protein
LPNAIKTEFHNDQQEILLFDVVNFLKGAWKTIAIFAFLGIVSSIAYLFVAPYQYEATAQIKLAQINFSLPTAPLGTPVEDQASLLARLQLPSNFGKSVIQACGYEEKAAPAQTLAKDLKFSIARGMVNIIELRLLAQSPQGALDCANAVVANVALLQAETIKPYVEEAKVQLILANERLDSAKRVIAKADQSGSAISAAYLSAKDETTFFLVAREKQLDIINSAERRKTKLAAPIYISEKPVSPKKSFSLLAGLFGGILLGFFLAIGRQLFARLKSQP